MFVSSECAWLERHDCDNLDMSENRCAAMSAAKPLVTIVCGFAILPYCYAADQKPIECPGPVPSRRVILNQTPEERLCPWLADSQRRLRRAWHPDESSQTSPCVLVFALEKIGKSKREKMLISKHEKIVTSSGSQTFDKAALDAIRQTNFRWPPDEEGYKLIKKKKLVVQFIDRPNYVILVRLASPGSSVPNTKGQ